jgi:hypothetical protein
VRDDEARTRRPRIGGVAAPTSEDGEILAIDQCEGEAELRLKFILPLPNHSSRSGDKNKIDAPPQEHFPKIKHPNGVGTTGWVSGWYLDKVQ